MKRIFMSLLAIGFLIACTGPQGLQGNAGPQGNTGPQGPVGPSAFNAVTVYDSMPSVFPPTVPSEAFQATQTSEFGNAVVLSGTARNAVSATVMMVTWSTLDYTWPITLNVYSSSDLSSPLFSVTQDFDIPAMPNNGTASCSGWVDSNGYCQLGLAFTVTFDLLGQTLPDSFVYGISLNTETYGVSPIGVDGPYDSLNIGLVTSVPSVGSTTMGTIYQNSITQGNYNTGVAGSFGMDTGWLNTFDFVTQYPSGPLVSNVEQVGQPWTVPVQFIAH